MKDRTPRPERWEKLLRLLLVAYPRRFRARHTDDLIATYRELWRKQLALGPARTRWYRWYPRMVVDLMMNAARVRMGGFDTAPLRGRTRAGGAHMIAGLWRDARHSLRTLARKPLFASVAVLTLGLGIGANTAIFSVVDAVLLEPLPYDEPDGLVWLMNRYQPDGRTGAISAPEFWELRRSDAPFEGLAAVRATATNVTGLDVPMRVQGAAVSPEYFELLRAQPSLGRAFASGEDHPDAQRVVILSHGLWMRAFGGDRSILGRSVEMDGMARTVVGVMPATHQALPALLFSGQSVDYWIPVTLAPETFDASSVEVHNLRVMGRLAPSVSLPAAEQALTDAVERIEAAYPGISNAGSRDVQVMRLRDWITGDVGPTIWVLLATVGLVLLVACLNVTNLLLARGELRMTEVAVRSALGANRRTLFSHALMESVIIGLVGGSIGVILALLAQEWLVALAPPGLPRIGNVGLSWTVLAFTLLLSLIAGLFAGAAPTLRLLRGDLAGALKAGGSRGAVGPRRHWFRSTLVVGQVAAAVVVVTAAGLLGRTFLELRSVDPGFDATDLLMVQVNAPRSSYPDLESVRQLYTALLNEVGAHPAVAEVSASWQTPAQGGVSDWPVLTEEEEADWEGADPNWVSNSYFATHGISLVEGRLFEPADLDRPEGTVIVSATAARRLWPGASAIGKRVNIDFDRPVWREVVGVVSDVKLRGPRSTSATQTYFPFVNVPFGPIPTLTVTVQTDLQSEALRAEVVRVLARIDPGVPVGPVRSMSGQLQASMSSERFLSTLMGAFGGLTLLLGTIGVYGLLSHLVSRRRREIGLRIALGARPSEVLGSVVLQAAALAGLGIALGLLGALGSGRLLQTFLFGVSDRDLVTFGAVALVVFGATVLASYVPARWAASVDPMTALRED